MHKALKKFLDHFDNNIVEYPRSWWRAAWSWKPLYWLRCHTVTKYHIIDCRNDYYDPSPYKWGWYDRCAILLLANFNILVDYIENERPGDIIDWGYCPESMATWDEINELYNWWKTGRKLEHQACDALLHNMNFDWDSWWEPHPTNPNLMSMKELEPEVRTKFDLYGAESDRLEKKDEEMLIRLIKVRMHLWT